MAVDTIVKPATTKAFPSADVEAKLRDLLLEAVTSDAELKGIALPADKLGKFAAGIHLDSLGVVDLLCGLEPLVGFDLKDSLVKAGDTNQSMTQSSTSCRTSKRHGLKMEAREARNERVAG